MLVKARKLHPTLRGREPNVELAPLEVGISLAALDRPDATVVVHGMGVAQTDNPSARRLEQVLWSGRLGRSANFLATPSVETRGLRPCNKAMTFLVVPRANHSMD
ncbi:MAG: hypothetical protein R3B96_07190 [Pirellulaceae bacterium]